MGNFLPCSRGNMPLVTDYAFPLSLVIFVVLERVVNAHLVLLARLIWGSSYSGENGALKGYAGTQLVGAGYSFLSSFASGLFSTVVGLISALSSYAIWVATAFLVFGGLFMLQEHYPTLLVGMVDAWNNNLGPFIYNLMFVPLQIGNILFTSIVPIYNGVIWLLKLLFHNVLLKSAQDNLDNVVLMGKALADLVKHVFVQVPSYLQSVAVPCPKPISDLCYDPAAGNRTFDFITPMKDVRGMSAAFLTIFIRSCGSGAGIMDIVLYPFMDINLAKAVHNIFNAILFTAFQIPSITVQRCTNNNKDVIMCLPDFEPPFNMLVAGIRNLGMMVDNWLDVSSIIVAKTLGLDAGAECDAQAQLLSPAAYSRDVFGTNRTIVVGLTPGLYAVTDGLHIQYFNHYDGVDSTVVPNAWPIPIDVRYGVAAVTYVTEQRDGSTGDTSTSMLGCRCLDNNGMPPMRIECALALKEAVFSGYEKQINTFEVVFQQRSTADYMTCSMAQISIQTVRWPASRFVSTSSDPFAVTSAISKSVVDATIWVSPLCTSRASKVPEVCVPMFKAAACYPYCMAARLKASGADGLVLYNANEWRDRVHLMHRDCSTHMLTNPVQAVQNSAAMYMPNGTTSAAGSSHLKQTVETVQSVTPVPGSSVVALKWDPNSASCVQSSMSTSMVGRDILRQLAPSRTNTFRSILLPGQPFAYASDVTLTAVQLKSGGFAVAVDRLYGSEDNEYSMINVLKNFPANPPADTPKLVPQERVDRLPIPYAFSDMAGVQHPSVSTRSSVFFAVNPSLAMFKGFASGCRTKGMEWRTQLSALSSYAPIRVWKIDPFSYCPHGDFENPECIGRVEFVDIPGAFTEIQANTTSHVFDINKCDMKFSVSVVGLEYINDENIAVTVLNASFMEFNPDTGLLLANSKAASYDVWFLSTETMALSKTPWNREILLSSHMEGQLCPAMRRLPNLGSLAAEVTVAGIEIVRKVLDLAIALPGMVQIWQNQRACSFVTHGHSILRRCGTDLLSLNDFFDALNRANAHFWRSFSIVAERIRSLNNYQLANIVDGVAYYGEASISPTQAYSSIITTTRIPTESLGKQVIQNVFPMGDRYVLCFFLKFFISIQTIFNLANPSSALCHEFHEASPNHIMHFLLVVPPNQLLDWRRVPCSPGHAIVLELESLEHIWILLGSLKLLMKMLQHQPLERV